MFNLESQFSLSRIQRNYKFDIRPNKFGCMKFLVMFKMFGSLEAVVSTGMKSGNKKKGTAFEF